MSKSHFNAPHFKDPEAARTYLEALRWGRERVCPHCGTVNHSFATKKRGLYATQGLPTERPVLIFALFLGCGGMRQRRPEPNRPGRILGLLM
jgi:hypothetical protein